MAKFICRHRSFKKIKRADLTRLAELALDDLRSLFKRKRRSRVYADRLMLLCLCQGAARHYVHGDRGINDLDVWAFFKQHPKYVFPYRRHGFADFGPSRFGRHPKDKARFAGRRVDILGRSIPVLSERRRREGHGALDGRVSALSSGGPLLLPLSQPSKNRERAYAVC